MKKTLAVLVLGTVSMFGLGCGSQAPARPIASGTLEHVTIWTKPVQRPGETGENSGSSPPKGSRVEADDHFILVTPKDGATVLSLHGWYTDLAFNPPE